MVYLHCSQAIRLDRLRRLMGQVFDLSIIKGGLVNILARTKPPLETRGEQIAPTVRGARVVHSDETSVQVEGRNCWEWVFISAEAALHLIRPSRGKSLPQEVFGDHRPGV